MPGQDIRWTHADTGYVPPEIDTSKPSVARVYDAVLGGKDNFAADRAVLALAQDAFPDGGEAAHINRALLGRAVRYMACEGTSQFLDLGPACRPCETRTRSPRRPTPPRGWCTWITTVSGRAVHMRAGLVGLPEANTGAS